MEFNLCWKVCQCGNSKYLVDIKYVFWVGFGAAYDLNPYKR